MFVTYHDSGLQMQLIVVVAGQVIDAVQGAGWSQNLSGIWPSYFSIWGRVRSSPSVSTASLRAVSRNPNGFQFYG